jgi:hypothetical protein
MVSGIVVLILMMVFSAGVIGMLKSKHPFLPTGTLMNLMFYHFGLSFVYYLYATFNSSDSLFYYTKVTIDYRGPAWGDFYGTSTKFIEFIAYPLIKYLGLSYEGVMAIFAMLGFMGFLYFYIFFRENIKFQHRVFGFDFITIVFFLPNLHFWTSSLGKGSIIFLALAFFFYSLSRIRARYVSLIIAGVLIYHIRPHIMLVILISSMIGFVFTTKGISLPVRISFLLVAVVAFFFIYRDVLSMVGIDEEQFVTQGMDLTHRANELTKATSGVDITNYSLPLQLFTFIYRPLFIDAPGILGIIVSFENLFYLFITFRLLTLRGLRFILTSNFLVKTCFFSFLTVSLALAQISGNLGLAMRQKSQVMILFLFVIISFMDDESMKRYQASRIARLRREKMAGAQSQTEPSK